MSGDRESLHVRVSGSAKTWSAILAAISALGGGGYYGLRQRERLDELELNVTELQNARATAERESEEQAQFWRDRFCDLETELVDEISSRVSLSAADAEPNRSRRADTAGSAQRAFDAASARWPCPFTPQALDERQRRASLRALAAGALSTRPPGR
jgi:hypothetical protein